MRLIICQDECSGRGAEEQNLDLAVIMGFKVVMLALKPMCQSRDLWPKCSNLQNGKARLIISC